MKTLLTVSLLAGAFVLQCIPIHAASPVTVYTTVEDFSTPASSGGWSGNTTAPSTAWANNGNNINGAANASPGGTGTAGSIAITPTGGVLNWTYFGELYIGNFATARQALDPGYIEAGAIFPEAQGTITMVYTLPDNAGGGAGTYFSPMVGFNASWGWSLYGPGSTVALGIVNGKEAYQATFSYSIPANAGGWGVNLMLGANSDYAPIETFYYDDIIVTDVVVVPEPGTMSLLGIGALGVLLARRLKISR
jgi:hypothetical protein